MLQRDKGPCTSQIVPLRAIISSLEISESMFYRVSSDPEIEFSLYSVSTIHCLSDNKAGGIYRDKQLPLQPK